MKQTPFVVVAYTNAWQKRHHRILHAHITKARQLRVRWMYFEEKYHNSRKYPTPLPLTSLPMGILSIDYITWKNIKLLEGLECSKQMMFLHCSQPFTGFNMSTCLQVLCPFGPCVGIRWAMVLIGNAKPAMSMVVFSTDHICRISSKRRVWNCSLGKWGLSIKHIGSLSHL